MRRAAPICAAVLLIGPILLGFFDGGWPDEPRLWAGIGACLLVAVAAVAVDRPLPRTLPGRLALGGLLALWALTALSLTWAPLGERAFADTERLALYAAALTAAIALLRSPAAARAVEPVLTAGTVLLVAVGLSERLLPWLITLHHSVAGGGRLTQPLGYWNAMGALAAIGLVLCAGLAGQESRATRTRALAAAAAPVLGAGLALSYSRGALVAAAAGLAILLLVRARHAQLRAAVVVIGAAAGAGLVAAALPEVGELTGEEGARSAQGAVLLALLVVLAAGAAAALLALARREAGGRLPGGRLPGRHVRAAAVSALAALVVAAVVLIVSDSGPRVGTPRKGTNTERLASVQSNRYDYWRVAVDTFADDPLKGAGSGAFGVEWLQRRTVAESVRDAHSLWLETAAELGLLGLAALAALVGGLVLAALRSAQAAALGALAAWAVFASMDWAWEMPTLSLIALILAGMVLAAVEQDPEPAETTLQESRIPAETAAAA